MLSPGMYETWKRVGMVRKAQIIRARVERGVTRSGWLIMEWGGETDEDVALVEERNKGRSNVERRDRE